MPRADHRPSETARRIVDAALSAFGTRGYEATSLDALAGELGITKQTILYWFDSKESLLDAVIDHVAAALAEAIEGALARGGDGLARVELVLGAVFRFGVRRPAVLGLLREVNRLGAGPAGRLEQGLQPLVDRAGAFLDDEMAAGTVRQADPRLTVLLLYATVVGAATELEAQRVVGLDASIASLRRLRRELFVYVHAALRP